MKLKDYQQEVLDDLSSYLGFVAEKYPLPKAYRLFWQSKGKIINNHDKNSYLRPYQDSEVAGVPRITLKVPTAGGKTFIACNTIKTIYDSGLFPSARPKVVVWLVPSDTILTQTFQNLDNVQHPYRQQLNHDFQHRVEIFQKEQLLSGTGFNPSSVQENLNVLVLSVQSLAANNKDGKRVFRDNSNLQSFVGQMPNSTVAQDQLEESSLMKVINAYNPVIIVDESHNVTSDLRVEMLQNLNPSIIVELTATPRPKANIISFVDAIKLKVNHMVKLPVMVYNQPNHEHVIATAKRFRNLLEQRAIAQQESGKAYIRPIVLFQAQPRGNDDNQTFEKIKKTLIESGIPANQIALKIDKQDDLKKWDLLSPDCPIRYIITVNALKEGWDCPFAYILASLANKTSKIDVEQIVGRILRQPYAKEQPDELLNNSYIFTCSTEFRKTLDDIIDGLQKSGYSSKSYREKEVQGELYNQGKTEEQQLVVGFELTKNIIQEPDENYNTAQNDESSIETEQKEGTKNEAEQNDDIIDISAIKTLEESDEIEEAMQNILQTSTQEAEQFKKVVEETEDPSKSMKGYTIKERFREVTEMLRIPQFFITTPKVKPGQTFSFLQAENEERLIRKKEGLLLKGFDLSKQDINIDFGQNAIEMAKIDIKNDGESEALPFRDYLNEQVKTNFIKYLSERPTESQIKQLIGVILNRMGKIDSISDESLKNYIARILQDLAQNGKLMEVVENEVHYAKKIKEKINSLENDYAKKHFKEQVDSSKILCKPHYKFAEYINPPHLVRNLNKHLYESEGGIMPLNGLENAVISQIASCENVLFWHRNIEKTGFCINTFLNHYPDFIVMLKDGRIVIVEVKGEHLQNMDSKQKIESGELWANYASRTGKTYQYFMVFENTPLIQGGISLSDFMKRIEG